MGEADTGPPAILAAFEAAPLMLVMCTGSPLVVRAQNDRARLAFGDHADQPLAGALDGADRRGLAERLEQVAADSETFTARAWPLVVVGAGGEEQEILVDLVAHAFSDGESARGVSVLAVDTTAAALAQHRDLIPALRLPSPPDRELVSAMQDALLPECLPVVPGAHLAASYLMADEGGGDWFDSFTLDDGRVALVVGDVVGRGAAAVGAMAELRVLLEETLRSDGDAVAALDRLERRASRALPVRGATVCVVLLDARTGEVDYCTAGHPPPLMLRPGAGATYLPATGGRALGTGSGHFATGHWQLEHDDVLLLYTDGLLERSDRDPATSTVDLGARGVEVLARIEAQPSTEPTVDRVCGDLLRRATALGFEDDVVVLGARRVAVTEQLHCTLPASVDALETARTALAGWFDEVPMSRLDESVLQHTVGELVANVAEHAYVDRRDGRPGGGDETCELYARLLAGGSVEIEVTDHGTWREPGHSEGAGRGLAMVEGFCDELDVDRTPHGTTVCARHRPGRQVALLTASQPAPPTATARMQLLDHDRVVAVSGVVDPRGADRLRRHLAQRTAGGVRPVLVDLAGVAQLGSAGVQVLVDAAARGAEVRLLAPMGTPAQHVLDLVGLPYVTQRPEMSV